MAIASASFFRRRFAVLIAAWGIALVVAGVLYWIEASFSAFHEVMIPLYWIIGALIILATWRWFRTRGRGDRRGKDRRHSDRRHE